METFLFAVQWFGALTAFDRTVHGGERVTVGAYRQPELVPNEGDDLLLKRPDGTIVKTKVGAVFQHSVTYSIVLPGLIEKDDVPRGTIVSLADG